MKTVCVVQARMGSVRLPGKVLLPLGGHSVLWHVLTACKQIAGIHEVICASPDEDRTSAIEAEAAKLGVRTFRGLEFDVLDRFYHAALSVGATDVMRITADCPLLDPEVCSKAMRLFQRFKPDYVSNVMPREYPKGLDCEVFTFSALFLAHKSATDAYDREHVTPWLQRNMRRRNLPGPGTQHLNYCLDTREDYERLKKMFRWKVAA